jgi:hypothetical protein
VHALKVLAAVVFVAGLVLWAADLRRSRERVAAGAATVLATATLLGAVPYSVVETLLDPSLSPAAADARLTATYDAAPWIGVVASVALPLVVLGLGVLAVVALRRRLVPAWAPVASLTAVPVAVLAGVLGGVGWAVPHPPAWIFLGLSAYGWALLRRPAAAAVPTGLTSRRS